MDVNIVMIIYRPIEMLLVFLALIGCSDKLPVPEIRYHTEHLHIGTEFEETLCAGTIDSLENHVVFLENILETRIDNPLEIYLYEDEPCINREISGCYDYINDRIMSTPSSAYHELVHAVSYRWGGPVDFYSEGVAEAFEGQRTEFSNFLPSQNLGQDSYNISRSTAGHFFRWLYEEYGVAPLKTLFKESRSRSSASNAEWAFEKAYGISIDVVENRYFDKAPESYPGFIWCDIETLPWSGPVWRHTLKLDCSEKHTQGHKNMIRVVGFEIGQSGRYTFEIEEPACAYITMCQTEIIEMDGEYGTSWFPVGHEMNSVGFLMAPCLSPGSVWELYLEPGKYRVEVFVVGIEKTTVRMQLSATIGTTLTLPGSDPRK